MMTHSHALIQASGDILASGSGDDARGIGLVFLLAGFVFYTLVYRRYRNTDKRYRHESRTQASLHNVQADDGYIRTRRRLSNRRMEGANNHAVQGSRLRPPEHERVFRSLSRSVRRLR